MLACALASLSIAAPAAAQFGLGQPGLGGPGGGGGKKKPAQKGPNGEETHAATSNDEQSPVQTAEPTLPPDPLEIPPAIRDQIGTEVDSEALEKGRGKGTERDWYGLYFRERSGSWQFQTLFPFWFERKQPQDRASLFGFYYNRSSPNHDANLLFPLGGRLRDFDTTTTMIGPLIHSEAPRTKAHPGRHDDWLAPLVFTGSSTDGSGYFHVPPLLTYTTHSAHDGLDVVGPLFCKWKGGPDCDRRTADDLFMGLAPFYFYARDHNTETEFIPPLIHYYRYNDTGDHSFNLWGPLLWEHSRESDVFNVMPVFWHNWGKNEDHLTVFPLFHYGYAGASNLLVTPLFLSARGDKGESTFATYLFARYRGRTELDMWSPLYWHFADPDIHQDMKLLAPFYYRNTSPRSDDIALFPFYARFHKEGLSDTIFVTPLFRATTDVTGWETDLFPLAFIGRSNRSSHTIVAPFLWDFATPHSRATVAAPVFYRFSDTSTVSQLVLNTYYHERKVAGGTDWEVHVFPFFSYGESPTGHWWNFLYGLAGYTHEGTKATMRTLWIPIGLSD
ncbi:MAG TPA: hypothetical protein VHB21_01060 [Minicystis sp.]|nr:hypothetical protein [Minicystis sp.]